MPQGTSEPQTFPHHVPLSFQPGLALPFSAPDNSHPLSSPELPHPQTSGNYLTILHMQCLESLPENPGRSVPFPGEAVSCGSPLALSPAKTGNVEAALEVTLEANVDRTSYSHCICQQKNVGGTAQPLRLDESRFHSQLCYVPGV